MDSYKKFLEFFQISKEDFFDWGIKATIFPPLERVQKEWGELRQHRTMPPINSRKSS